MSAEARRVFKMEVILSLIADKVGGDVVDLLNFLTKRDLNDQEAAVAATLGKAWLFSLNPELMKSEYDETAIYEEWVAKESKRLGDNVSVTPIDDAELAPINAILDTMAANKSTIADQAAQIDELKAKVEELEPFTGKAADLENKVEQLEGKVADLEEKKAELSKANAEFAGKLPVAEDDLNSTIKDIVTKAIKDAAASVPLGTPGAAAAEGGEAAAAAEEVPAEDAVPDTFGFGASGSDSGGFGF